MNPTHGCGLRRCGWAAFTIVEIALAIGVAAFGLLAIIALLPVGIGSIRDSAEEIAALSLAYTITADIGSSSEARMATSHRYGLSLPDPGSAPVAAVLYLAESGLAADPPSNARYRFDVLMKPPTAGSGAPMSAHVRATWPPAADPLSASTQSTEILAAVPLR